jgi:hypothetical protein
MPSNTVVFEKQVFAYIDNFRNKMKPALGKNIDITGLAMPCEDGKILILFTLGKHQVTGDEILIESFINIDQAFEQTKLDLSTRNNEKLVPHDFKGTTILVGSEQIIVMKDVLATQNMNGCGGANDANKITSYGSDVELANNCSMYKLTA